MIATCELSDFGPITSFNTEGFDNLNLIIGKNSSGKTWLLKLLYAVIRSQEEHGRGDDNREFYEVLSDKLYWTFQTDHLGLPSWLLATYAVFLFFRPYSTALASNLAKDAR